VKSRCGYVTVREMKYTSQHCCDKLMDGKMTLSQMLFSEFFKIMVNELTFVGRF